jgi:hypothetical protein
MRAIEFNTTILSDGKISLPESLHDVIPQKPVRVILLWTEQEEEEAAWQEASLSIFREGDGPYDALYDNL